MTGLDLVVRATVVLAAAAVAACILGRAAAAVRHLVWTAAFAALLLLPAAMGWWPKLTLAALPVAAQSTQALPLAARNSAISETTSDTTLIMRESRAPWIPLVYLAGMLSVALRFLIGAARTARMVRGAAPAAYAQGLAERLRSELSIERGVCVLESDAAVVPMTWGVVRPVVMLPFAAGEWPAHRLRAVVMHELIHVQRRDLLVQTLGQAACCLYWFHPLVWFGARQLRKERERACDDAVLGGGVAPAEYAGHMLAIARAMVAQRRSLADAPAMAEAGDLEARIRAVLDSTRNRSPLTRRMAAGAAALTIALVLAATVNLVPAQAAVEHEQSAAPAPASALPAPHQPEKNSDAAVVARRDAPSRVFVRPHDLLATVAPVVEEQATAPSGTASLAGIVRDPSGARVVGSSILIKNLDGKNQETTKANAVGEYGFAALPAGRYSVEVRQPGFRMATVEVVVSAGTSARADVNLAVGQISQAITVKGSRPATGAIAQPAPAAASSTGMPPQRIPIGGNVQAAKLLRQTRPEYPADLKAQGITGVVTIRAIISKTGEPLNPEVINTSVNPGLAAAALDAVRQWRYTPTLLNGQPVEVVTTIDVSFELDQ